MESEMNFLNKHLREVNEGYLEHMGNALRFSARMLIGSVACALHGFFPFLFERTGSGQIKLLHEQMVTHRMKGKSTLQRMPQAPVEASD